MKMMIDETNHTHQLNSRASQHKKLDTIPSRDKIKIGSSVSIVQKQDQGTGKLTNGTVKRILTSSSVHPHGIKVELHDGKIGRVQKMA